jgi:hypothetical protein
LWRAGARRCRTSSPHLWRLTAGSNEASIGLLNPYTGLRKVGVLLGGEWDAADPLRVRVLVATAASRSCPGSIPETMDSKLRSSWNQRFSNHG